MKCKNKPAKHEDAFDVSQWICVRRIFNKIDLEMENSQNHNLSERI